MLAFSFFSSFLINGLVAQFYPQRLVACATINSMALTPTGMQQDNQVFSLGGVLLFKLVGLYCDWVIVSGLTLYFSSREKP